MRKELLTDEQIEMEIERMRDSEYVRLAEKEIRLKMKRRKYYYQLRWLEKRGRELEEMGFTFEDLKEQLEALENLEEGENFD